MRTRRRRAGNSGARHAVADLGLVPAEALERAKVSLVVVGCAPAKFIKSFRERAHYPYAVYCDPERAIYQRLGRRSARAPALPRRR